MDFASSANIALHLIQKPNSVIEGELKLSNWWIKQEKMGKNKERQLRDEKEKPYLRRGVVCNTER